MAKVPKPLTGMAAISEVFKAGKILLVDPVTMSRIPIILKRFEVTQTSNILNEVMFDGLPTGPLEVGPSDVEIFGQGYVTEDDSIYYSGEPRELVDRANRGLIDRGSRGPHGGVFAEILQERNNLRIKVAALEQANKDAQAKLTVAKEAAQVYIDALKEAEEMIRNSGKIKTNPKDDLIALVRKVLSQLADREANPL